MNHGASNARNDILFFLHVDTRCQRSALLSIRHAIDQGASGGCLTQRIDHNATIYRHIESKGNRVARKKKTFFGDFGIFVRKDIFEKLGGFPAIPIMEDLVFSKKMRQAGQIVVLEDRLLVSPRRWEHGGVFRTMLLHNLLHFLFLLKVPPAVLKRLYADLR